MIKPEDIQLVQDMFNSFHKNLRFTVDRFENEVPHFLDIEMSAQDLTIYRKNTHTGQYVHYGSLLHGIIKLVGSVVLLQEPNVFVV